MAEKMVHIADIVGVKGLKGAVRLKSYSYNPKNILDYKVLYTKSGSILTLSKCYEPKQNFIVAEFKEVHNRDEAENLNGTELYIPRNIMPELDNSEFYIADLIGLNVEQDGEIVGSILSVQNFGAGTMIEVAWLNNNPSTYIPFQDAFVPTVDIANKKVVIVWNDKSEDEQ